MNMRCFFTLLILAFSFIAVIGSGKASAQLGSCSSYGSNAELCNAQPDCHYCPVLGIYGCTENDQTCIECVDLDEDSCDEVTGCFWCPNQQLCLPDDISCACGDGYLQSGEDCDPASGDADCVDCQCANGTVPGSSHDCVCDGDEDCNDGLACNGVETCDENGYCLGGTSVSCTDDELWCNGDEICDWQTDACLSRGLPSAAGSGLGNNEYGQLGDGSKAGYLTAPYLFAGDDVIQVAGGKDHTLFVTSTGALWAMGGNNYGQLGNGTTTASSVPIEIESSGVVCAAAGDYHSLFVKKDGSLWGMGRNDYGQLGTPDNNPKSPVQTAKPGSGVIDVAAGEGHSHYVTNDGNLFAMGLNYDGQLGIGHRVDRAWPVQVVTGGSVVAVAAGGKNSAFILDDGTLKVMGKNDHGQIGDASVLLVEDAILPNTVSISNVSHVAVGAGHILFSTTGGQLYSMGYNEFGQLGTGDNVDYQTPVSIVASGVTAVAAGDTHSLFVREYESGVNDEGAFYGMGSTNLGQLGDDSQSWYNTPILIVQKLVQSIAAGGNHTLYLRSQSDGCMIDASCAAAGAAQGGNTCIICDPAVSRTSWTVNDGGLCDDGNYCNGEDTCSGDSCSIHAGDPCTEPTPYCYCDPDCSCHADASVNLLEFAARRQGDGVLLSWLTGSELQCGAFTVLRCELDATPEGNEPLCAPEDHVELDSVIPCANDPLGSSYDTFDETAGPAAAWSYYLREYSADGGMQDYGPRLVPLDDPAAEMGVAEKAGLSGESPSDDDSSAGSRQANDDDTDNDDIDDDSGDSGGGCGR